MMARSPHAGRPIGSAGRPLLCKSVIASLDALAKGTAATDETEAGLRYIRALVAHERRPDIIAKRKRTSAAVQAFKRKRGKL